MSPLSLSRFLQLYTWFPLAALLLVLLLIARFYEKFSGERTHYRLFAVPIVLLGVGTVRYASLNSTSGDLLADLLLGLAGILLIVLCAGLYRRMLLGRARLEPPQ